MGVVGTSSLGSHAARHAAGAPDALTLGAIGAAPAVIPGSSLVRKMALNQVMTSPPVITAGTSQPGAMTQVRQFNTYGFNPWNGFRISGGPVNSTRFPVGITTTNGTPAPVQPLAIEFDFEGDQFAFATQAKTTSFFHLWINEQRWAAAATSLNSISGVSGIGTHYYTVAFAARTRVRVKLEIVCQPNLVGSFNGLFFAPTCACMPPSITSPRLVVVGDSYGAGIGTDVLVGTATTPLNNDTTESWPWMLGRMLGYADVWNFACIPSTGFVHTDGTYGPYVNRYAGVLPYVRANDILILQGSINDGDQTSAAITAQVAADLAYWKAQRPNTLIAVTAPLVIKTAAVAAGAPFLDTFDQSQLYFYGTGNVNGTTGDGPADYYGADQGTNPSQHPSPAGHRAIARLLAAEFAVLLPSTASSGDDAPAVLDPVSIPLRGGVGVAGTNSGASPSNHVHPRSYWGPEDHGLIAWAFDPACLNSSAIPTAGVLQMTRLKIPKAVTVTNVLLSVATGGGTLTVGQSFAGLFDASRNLLSGTADQAAAWQSAGTKIIALTTPQAVAAGDYYVGFYWGAGTTGPTFARGASSFAINANVGTSVSRFATSSTGLTTALPNPGAALAAGTNSFWAAVS